MIRYCQWCEKKIEGEYRIGRIIYSAPKIWRSRVVYWHPECQGKAEEQIRRLGLPDIFDHTPPRDWK